MEITETKYQQSRAVCPRQRGNVSLSNLQVLYERLFRRLKGFRRIFLRFEKLDVMFGFIHFALIVEAFRSVNMP